MERKDDEDRRKQSYLRIYAMNVFEGRRKENAWSLVVIFLLEMNFNKITSSMVFWFNQNDNRKLSLIRTKMLGLIEN